MPCYTDRNGEAIAYVNRENSELKAILCGVFSLLEKTNSLDEILSNVDWEESGVSERTAKYYWTQHKEEDRQRKMNEEQRRIKEFNRQRALSKLNNEEKKALGILNHD